MSDDDRISKPSTPRFPMPNDIDFTRMYQHTVAPLNLSEEQKKSLSDEEYAKSIPVYQHREPATSKSSRFGSTDAFVMDCTPVQFDGPLDRSGFIREIILVINDVDATDVVRYPIEVNLSYSDTDPAAATVSGSIVLTPASKTIGGSPLNYFSKTDAADLKFAFQLYCSVESDTGVVHVIDTIQIVSKDFIMPFSVSIIAVDLCMFKKQENTMTENQNNTTTTITTDNSPDVFANGHLQLHTSDTTTVIGGVDSTIVSFTATDALSNTTLTDPHFRLKPIINELRFEKMYPDVKIPQKQTSGSAGMDVHAYLPESVVIPPGERRLIPTGLKTCFPEWMELQVRSRSGLALKHGIIVLNAPGTIDADYPGELGIILYNTSMTPYLVQHDARIAQLVPASVLHIPVVEGVREEETSRTSSGFGSTGV